jgi:DNA-directed RNA polymerase alpha subunit
MIDNYVKYDIYKPSLVDKEKKGYGMPESVLEFLHAMVAPLADLVAEGPKLYHDWEKLGTLRETNNTLATTLIRINLENLQDDPLGSRLVAAFPEYFSEEKKRPVMEVYELNFNTRIRKVLNRLNCRTVKDLVTHTAEDLLERKNFGETSLREVREKLALYNLYLAGEGPQT